METTTFLMTEQATQLSPNSGINEILNAMAKRFDAIAEQKRLAWIASDYSTASSGQEWRDKAHALRVITGEAQPKVKLYQRLAQLIDQNNRCLATVNTEWFDRSMDAINEIMASAPSGSGIDNGTKLIETVGASKTAQKNHQLVFQADYHHMNDAGMYDGWSYHQVVVKPSLQYGFELEIMGENRNDIKEVLYQEFEAWLNSEVEF